MRKRIILIILSVVFTLGLVFASLELPLLLDNQIQDSVNFLSFDQQANDLNISKTNLYIEYYHLKEVGYISLGLIILLIFFGFYFNKKGLSLLGAFAAFLPVFGHFALSMFFLAGLGFLRVIWMPVTEVSPFLMRCGDIIYLPNKILLYVGKLFGVHLSNEIAIFFIIIGVLIFVMGVYVWFSTKYLNNNVAKSFIYKISRHPQYLGWILWSYGLFLLPQVSDSMKKSWGYPDSLPCLFASMIIIAVSLLEEINMKKKFGAEYDDFRRKTAFMFPLPLWLRRIIKHPLKLFFKTSELTRKRHVLVITSYYTVLFMLISFLILSFTEPQIDNPLLRNKKKGEIVNLIEKLKNGKSVRQKDFAAMELERYGYLATPYLLKTLKNENEITRSLSIWTLRKIGDTAICKDIIEAVRDTSEIVLLEALRAIGDLRCKDSKDVLLSLIYHQNQRIRDYAAVSIGKLGVEEATPILKQQFDGLGKYSKIAYIGAFGNIKSYEGLTILHEQLKSDDNHIVYACIVALSKIRSKNSIPYLESLKLSDDWETRLYAKKTIKIINNNH